MRITSADILRAALLITGAFGQFAAGFAPDLLGWEQTIASRSAESRTALIPGGGAFVIWLPLFVGAIAFAIFHALPKQIVDPDIAKIGGFAATAFWMNTIRSLYEPAFGPGWVSLAMLFGILLPLLAASLVIRNGRPLTRAQSWALAPVLGQAGWISIACAAGVTQTLEFTGTSPPGLGGDAIALATLAIWAVLIAPALVAIRSWVYVGAVVWGLLWIAATNFARGPDAVALASAAAVLVVLILTLLGKVRSRVFFDWTAS